MTNHAEDFSLDAELAQTAGWDLDDVNDLDATDATDATDDTDGGDS